jgi:hypothetical protein
LCCRRSLPVQCFDVDELCNSKPNS